MYNIHIFKMYLKYVRLICVKLFRENIYKKDKMLLNISMVINTCKNTCMG